MDFYSVEKIIGEKAVLELPDKSFAEFLLSDLPEGVREGDLLYKTDFAFVPDEKATLERRKRLHELQNSLFDNEGEDFEL